MNNLVQNKKRSLGSLGERFAQAVYVQKGYKIFDTNVFNRKGKQVGEVDFIAIGKNDIAFVEVKTRKDVESSYGTGAEAVDIFKQRKILKMVKFFLIRNSYYMSLRPHVDVVAIVWPPGLERPSNVHIHKNVIEDFS